MEENLQLEEVQKSNQQAQDQIPYDPNAALKNPDGYTSVPDVLQETPVEEVSPNLVDAVEVTNPQVEDFRNIETLGSSGDFITGDNILDNNREVLYPLQFASIENASLDPVLDTDWNIIDTVGDISDPDDEVEVVDPPVPPVDPPADPPVPPVDPEDPEDPEEPEDPEDPEEPEDPEDPEDPDSEHPNNGFGNGDQDAPGNSLDNNNAENDQTPGEQGNSHQNNNGNGGGGGNNGFGNGDQDAPGNSGPNNNAENAESPNPNIGDLIDRFVEENPGTEWREDSYNQYDDNNSHLDSNHSEIESFDFQDYYHIPEFHDINLDIHHNGGESDF